MIAVDEEVVLGVMRVKRLGCGAVLKGGAEGGDVERLEAVGVEEGAEDVGVELALNNEGAGGSRRVCGLSVLPVEDAAVERCALFSPAAGAGLGLRRAGATA